jgi:undecaprenyl-diphosphatase
MSPSGSRYILFAAIGLAAGATAVSVYALVTPRFPGDLSLALSLQSFDNPALRSSMEWVSFLAGSWRAALLVMAVSAIIWRLWGWKESALLAGAAVVSLIHLALKVAVNRPRPAANLVQVLSLETNNGFPSGHAFWAILVLGLLAYFIAVRLGLRRLEWLPVSLLALLILFIGASRVYLGVHWPSDIWGGYLIGGAFLTLFIWGHRKWGLPTKG